MRRYDATSNEKISNEKTPNEKNLENLKNEKISNKKISNAKISKQKNTKTKNLKMYIYWMPKNLEIILKSQKINAEFSRRFPGQFNWIELLNWIELKNYKHSRLF
jgi:hypothetical protein